MNLFEGVYLRRVSAIALALAVAIATGIFHCRQALAKSPAVIAFEDMRYVPRAGDSGLVTIRTIEKKAGKDDVFEAQMTYELFEAGSASEGGHAFTARVRVLGARMKGMPTPDGFDDALKALMPPVEIMLNKDLAPLGLVDAKSLQPTVQKNLKEVAKTARPKTAMALMLLSAMFVDPKFYSTTLQPISDLQKRRWSPGPEGGFDAMTVREFNGIRISGQRTIVPAEVTEDRIISVTTGSMDPSAFVAKMKSNPLFKLLDDKRAREGKAGSVFDGIAIRLSGEAVHNRKTGWLLSLKEEMTLDFPNLGGAPQRNVIIEIEQEAM